MGMNNNVDLMSLKNKIEIAYDEISDEIPALEKAVNDLAKYVDRLKNLCEWYQESSHVDDEESEIYKWDSDMNRRLGELQFGQDQVYQTIYKALKNYRKLPEIEASLPDLCEIKVAVKDNKLFAKTPLLLNRNSRYIHTKGGAFPIDYYRQFGPILADKIMEIEFQDYPANNYKNVDLLAVYPTSEVNIPDTNNLDDKTIVDALLLQDMIGDAATYCSFSSASIRSDQLSPGTYFSVTPGFCIRPDPEETVRIMIELFENPQQDPGRKTSEDDTNPLTKSHENRPRKWQFQPGKK